MSELLHRSWDATQTTSTSILSSIAMSSASPKRRGHQLLTSLNRQTTGSWPLPCAHRGCSAWPRPPYTEAGTETADALSACRDTAQIRQILFASLIPAAVEATPRTGRTRTYSEQNVQRWLRTLAQHLEQRRTEHSGGTQIALDQIWRLAGAGRCRVLHAVIGVAAGLAMGLLLSGFSIATGTVIASWLTLGGVLGIMSGLRFGLAGQGDVRNRKGGPKRFARKGGPKRFAWRVPDRSRWRRGLKRGLYVVLPLGIPVGIMELPSLLRGGARPDERFLDVALFSAGLAFLLLFGLLFGLVSGLGTTPEERLALGQNAERIIHDDLESLLIAGIVWLAGWFTIYPVVGLPVGLAIAYYEGRTSDPSAAAALKDWPSFAAAALQDWPYLLLDVLGRGLVYGLFLAVVAALLSSVTSGRYATASLLFGFTGIFPRRPARFLQWARNSGLLRVTGVAYQFRHDSYQQWLAAGNVDRGLKTTLEAQAD